MEAGEQEQMEKYGWCIMEKKMTKHISTVSPKGDWVCTMCRCRCSELKKEPRVKKIDYLSWNVKK